MNDNQDKIRYAEQFWNERYSDSRYSYGENPNDFLVKNMELLKPGGDILCLSEGEGRNAVFLASKGFKVSAVDLSVVGKKKALKLAQKNNVHIEYEVANLNDYNIGEEIWDGIISISAHVSSEIRAHLHLNIKKGLKKGGIFLLEGYNSQQLQYKSGGPKDIDLLFSRSQLELDFADVTVLCSQDIIREVNEGEYHKGEASVTQFIAKK